MAVRGLAVCLALAVGRAEITPATAAPYFFDRFSSDSGLSTSNVLDVLQTRDGFLWLGTSNGAARFDGKQFRSYATDPVACLFEDRDGNLWAGTDHGVARWRDGAFVPAVSTDVAVTCLAQDRDGTLWIGTNGHGLYASTPAGLRSYEHEPAMPSAHIGCLYVDTAGRLWVGFLHGAGLVCRTNGVFRRYDGDERLQTEVHAICEEPRGVVWLGLSGPRLARISNHGIDFIGPTQGLRGTAVTKVRPAVDGAVWAITESPAALYRIDGSAVTELPGLPAESIATMCEDRESNLWFAAREDGLVRATPMPFALRSNLGRPGSANIKRVAEDRAGNLWITTARGEVLRSTPADEITRYSRANGLPGPASFALPARDGSVWLACTSLYHWVNGTCTAVPSISGIQGMYEDRRGRIWVGCQSRGLVRLERGEVVPVLTDDGKPIEYATEFAESDDGTLYIGTWTSGLVRLKDGQAVVIDHRHGLPSDEVRAVYVDHENRVWVGMRRKGLAVCDGGCWRSSPELSRAMGGHVAAILEDSVGRLWLGTPNGVMFGPKEQLLAIARGERAASDLRLAGMTDGNHVTPVPTGGNPVACRTPAGRLIFATRTGVLAIDPAHVPSDPVPPPAHVDRVAIDGRWLDRASRLDAPAGTREIALEYTAPIFRQTRRTTFEYRLAGYDQGWIHAGTRRIATYANLPPGTYAFQVRARNSDGVLSATPDRLAIVQRPHFYQTAWFWALATTGLGTFGLAGLRYSQRRLRRKLHDLAKQRALEHGVERERRRIAKNLHDELGASLTEIGLAIDLARRHAAHPPAASELRTVRERVRTMAQTLDAVVWSVNPAHDSLPHLASYLSEAFQDLARMAAIRCRLEISEPPPPHPLTPDERANLYLTAKEAMNNAIKHARATEVLLRMGMHEDRFCVSIEDNGCGFDPAAPAANTRNGLANMRSRIAELRGSLTIDSAPGRGTIVQLSVSFPRVCASRTARNGH